MLSVLATHKFQFSVSSLFLFNDKNKCLIITLRSLFHLDIILMVLSLSMIMLTPSSDLGQRVRQLIVIVLFP